MMFTLEGNWFSVLRGLCLCFCASNTVREADSQFWTCICLVILYVFQYMFLITILPYLKHTFHCGISPHASLYTYQMVPVPRCLDFCGFIVSLEVG